MADVFLVAAAISFAFAAFGLPTGRLNLLGLGLLLLTLALLTPALDAALH